MGGDEESIVASRCYAAAALKDLDLVTAHRTDMRAEQRGLEQMLHDQYSPPLNAIRPISPGNPKLNDYMDAARRFLGVGE